MPKYTYVMYCNVGKRTGDQERMEHEKAGEGQNYV